MTALVTRTMTERKNAMTYSFKPDDDSATSNVPEDDREDHGISTYDDDEEMRKKIARMGLKI